MMILLEMGAGGVKTTLKVQVLVLHDIYSCTVSTVQYGKRAFLRISVVDNFEDRLSFDLVL